MNQVKEHFDKIAEKFNSYKMKNAYFHRQIKNFYKQIIPEGCRVLEVGCATADLLASVKPAYGVGIDISENMLRIAKQEHPGLHFISGDIRQIEPVKDFDFIILSNLLDYIDDIYQFLESLKNWADEDTRIIINNINPLWAPVIRIGARLKLRTPDTKRNFLTLRDLTNLLEILEFDISEKGFRLIFPFYIPFFSLLVNKIFPRIYFLNNFSFMQYVVCRKAQLVSRRNKLSSSVIVPCHNEEENIAECIRRIPALGRSTEIIVVDDGSTDNTFAIAEQVSRQDARVRVIQMKKNFGKAKAVKTGFDQAKGDVLMILDADMAVDPEDLVKFFNTLSDGEAEFVNGTRMVYPMEKEAMKFFNYLGNKIFGISTSIIMGQRNTDTLCGTKALLRRDYRHITINERGWGDFDLLYGAAKLKLKMVEMPVHYHRRAAGKSKMKALRHCFGMVQRCFEMFWNLE